MQGQSSTPLFVFGAAASLILLALAFSAMAPEPRDPALKRRPAKRPAISLSASGSASSGAGGTDTLEDEVRERTRAPKSCEAGCLSSSEQCAFTCVDLQSCLGHCRERLSECMSSCAPRASR